LKKKSLCTTTRRTKRGSRGKEGRRRKEGRRTRTGKRRNCMFVYC
jgi:hypothetical protein